MKTKIITFLFLCIGLLAQNRIPVSKLVGTWYLDKAIYECQDLRCTGEGYDFYLRNPEEKLHVFVKDGFLVFSTYDPNNWELHYKAPSIFAGFMGDKIQADTLHMIKNDSITSYSIHVTDSTLMGSHSLHGPSLLYKKDSAAYLRDILLKHSWKSGRCLVHEDGGFCPEENFYMIGDTLVYQSQAEGPLKFLYNNKNHVYENLKYKERKLKILNDSVLSIDSYQLKRVKTSDGPIADLVGFQGKWLSTTRLGVYVAVDNSKIETNIVRTYTSKFRNERPYVYLEETALPSGYALRFDEYKSEDFSRWAPLEYDTVPFITFTLDNTSFISDQDLVGGTFIQKALRFRFMLREGNLYDMNTGEVFSRVVGLSDDQKSQVLSVWPNPCVTGDIHLGLENVHYQIFSAEGDVIEQGFSADGKVALQNKRPGMYLLKVQSGSRSYSNKLSILE